MNQKHCFLLNKYQTKCVGGPPFHEILSIIAQPHMYKVKMFENMVATDDQRQFQSNEKGDFHIFHLLNIFHFYNPIL